MPNIQRTPQKPQAKPDEVPRMADKSPEELEAERLEEEAKKAAAETERKKKDDEKVEEPEEKEEEEEDVQPKDMRVQDLRPLLRLRGLSPSGTKAELVARLEAALEKEKNDSKKKKNKPPDKKKDPGGEEIEDIELKLNKAIKAQENREQQIKKLKALLAVDAGTVDNLKKQKKKLLASPANTEDFKKKIHDDIEKKRAKKKLFEEDDDPPPVATDDDDDDDIDDQGSQYSQAWSVFGMTQLQKIINKLDKAAVIADKATQHHKDDKEVLKSAVRQCQEAQNYVENNAEKCGQIEPHEKEEVEDQLSELDGKILKLNILLSKIDNKRSEKSSGIKPVSPKWDPLYPSGFLSFHKAFKEAFRHQSSRIQCEAYKAAITGPERRATLSLIAGVDSDFEEIEKIMFQHYGDILSLLPAERAKIASLKPAHTDEEEKENLLVILEHWHLLQSHGAEEHFDFELQFQIKRVLKKEHSNDLRIRKPENRNAFIKRLEAYLADVSEFLRVFDKERKKKSDDKENKKKDSPPTVRQYSTGYQQKKRCSLCKTEDSHWTSDCHKLRNKTKDEVKDIFFKKNACHICFKTLGAGHITPCSKQYFNKKENKMKWRTCRCCGINNRICRGKISDSSTPGGSTQREPRREPETPVTISNSTKVQTDQQIILNGECGIGQSVSSSQVLKIKLPGSNKTVNAVAIYDNQSQNCLFDEGLKFCMENYKESLFSVETVNNTTTRRGGVGDLTVVANNGREYKIRGLVQKINNRNIDSARFLIPKKWIDNYDMKEEEFTCSGKLSIIIGNDMRRYFPTKVDSHGGVDLEESFFDRKLILTGFNKGEVITENPLGQTCRSNRTNLHGIDKAWLDIMNPSQGFVSANLCPACKDKPECVDCKNQILTKTRLQIHEENLLADGLTFDDSAGRWMVKAPYKACIQQVPVYERDSQNATERLVKRLRIVPDGRSHASSLDKTVKENLENGMWAWEEDLLKENEDFKNYQKIVNPINIALKPDSVNTKVRLVHNLSFKKTGFPSFNDAQLTGSSLNQKLHLILLRQRGYKYLSFNDLVRHYNQVALSYEDMRKHCFLYKKNEFGPDLLGENSEYKTICSRRLVFGSKMSQNLANLAKIKTSEMFVLPLDKDVHEDVLFSYTDDVAAMSNISLADLERKKNLMEEGLAKGGFPMKKWVTSYDQDEENNRNITGFSSTMLGVFYNPAKDSWTIKANVNFAKKVRNLRPELDQIHTREELRKFIQQKGLTKLNCLQAAHQLFDPLSLLLPIKANLSLAYRQLLIKNPNMNYSDSVPQDQLQVWEKVIGDLLDARQVEVPRSALPLTYNDTTEVSVCAFCDGGESASVTRLFIRTKLPDGGFHVVNVFNSFKLGDLGNNGAPKSEISGFLTAARNLELITNIWKHVHFSSLHIFSDSTVCLGSLNSFTSKLRLYFSDKVLEIVKIIDQKNIKVHFISGKMNPANFGSKLDLGPTPVLSADYWTVPFLQLPEEEWPVKDYHYDISDISSLINPKMANSDERSSLCLTTKIDDSILNLIGRFPFNKAVTILSFLYQWKAEVRDDPKKAQLKAREFLYSLASPTQAQISGLQRQYNITKQDNGPGIFLISRPFTMGDQISQRKLRLLDGKSLVGRSILQSFHVHCQSIDRQIAKILENGLFLVGSRSYLQKMMEKCKTCLRIRKTAQSALQGPSPQLESALFPVYYQSVCDVVGPIKVSVRSGVGTRGNTKIRKAYILSLTCLWSRHLSLTLLDDLSASTFLTALLTISCQLGGAAPAVLFSDFGSNIITLRKLEGDDVNENEVDKMTRSMKTTFLSHGIKLVLSSPKAPWRQGLVERLHRNFKMALKRSGLFHQTLDITKWNYILSKMSFTINERPLNVQFVGQTWTVLTPNKLLFGERKGHFPREITLELGAHNLYSQLDKLEKDLSNWRDVWERSYQQEIQKFLVFKTKSKRDLTPGDIVMITDHRGPGGGNSLGQIIELLSDRTVKLQYVQRQAKYDKTGHLIKPRKLSSLIRPVQNLVYLTCPTEKIHSLDPFYDDEEPTTTSPATTSPVSTNTASTPTATTSPATTTLTAPAVPVTTSSPEDDPPSLSEEKDSDSVSVEMTEIGNGSEESQSSPTSAIYRPAVKVNFVPDSEVDSEIKDIIRSRKTQKKHKN